MDLGGLAPVSILHKFDMVAVENISRAEAPLLRLRLNEGNQQCLLATLKDFLKPVSNDWRGRSLLPHAPFSSWNAVNA
jgi:hypothetical protein